MRTPTLLPATAMLWVLVNYSQAATYATAVLADNPIAYWRLDGNANDSSASGLAAGAVNGNPAAGTVTYQSSSLVPAEAGNGSVALAGTGAGSERIQIPGFEKIGSGGFSAEYWVNVTAYPGACCDSLVSDGVSGGDFWMMNYLIGPGQGVDGAVRPHFGIPGTVSITTNTSPLTLNQTYHVVTTYDAIAGTGTVYFDGVPVLSAAVTATLPAPGTTGDNDIYIGRDDRENRPSNFMIDEVALYDYPLSAAQVQNHYNIGSVPEPGSTTLLALILVPALMRRQR